MAKCGLHVAVRREPIRAFQNLFLLLGVLRSCVCRGSHATTRKNLIRHPSSTAENENKRARLLLSKHRPLFCHQYHGIIARMEDSWLFMISDCR